MKITSSARNAAARALGYYVHCANIRNACAHYDDVDDAGIARLLREKETVFDAAGGRGVDLADEIDELRIVLAVRKARQTPPK